MNGGTQRHRFVGGLRPAWQLPVDDVRSSEGRHGTFVMSFLAVHSGMPCVRHHFSLIRPNFVSASHAGWNVGLTSRAIE